MHDEAQRQILSAFLVVLKPIARILLRFGIGFREFSEIAKIAFVEVATSDFGIRGRPTNISRVAVMTGLTRKEVRRLRDKLKDGTHNLVVKPTPLWDVLHHWHSEQEFNDNLGKPAALPFAGEEGSFTSLVKRFGGDIPAGAMRTELKRVGAVKELQDGKLELLRRTFRAEEDHSALVASLIHAAFPMMATINHNASVIDGEGKGWPEYVTYTQSVRSSDTPRLRRITSDRMKEFAESIDDLFMAYETLYDQDVPSNDNDGGTIAVGMFYFEDHEAERTYKW